MPPTCTVCSHEKRREIDKALVNGESLRDIARRHGPLKDALHRHRECIKSQLAKAEIASGLTARGVMLRLITRLESLADDCANEIASVKSTVAEGPAKMVELAVVLGHVREMFLRTADRLTRASESYGKLTGEIQAASVAAFLAQIGVQSESEVRDALHLTRAARDPSLEECLEEGVAIVLMVLKQKPEWRARTEQRICGAAVEAEFAVVPKNGNGNGNGAHA